MVSIDGGGGFNMEALNNSAIVFERYPTFHADDSLTDFESRSVTPKCSYEQHCSDQL